MSAPEEVFVFEFSDHVRVALQLTYLVRRDEAVAPKCTLFLREDCREFMSTDTPTVGDVRYLNKYLMAFKFWFYTAVLRRKALVSTGPESASPRIQSMFAKMLRSVGQRSSVFVIVRDLNPERGGFLLHSDLYGSRSRLAVESDALRRACLANGYKPDAYLYPTPIVASDVPGGPFTRKSHDKGMFSILITGSLDGRRRDYVPLLDALSHLMQSDVRVRLIVGGHCLASDSQELLKQLEPRCEELVAAPLLSDRELDVALMRADALVCLNRPSLYGGIKGSGAIGDAFFAGKKLLIHADLAAPSSEDAEFYVPFTSAEALADQLARASSDSDWLKVPREVLLARTNRFAETLAQWLRL